MEADIVELDMFVASVRGFTDLRKERAIRAFTLYKENEQDATKEWENGQLTLWIKDPGYSNLGVWISTNGRITTVDPKSKLEKAIKSIESIAIKNKILIKANELLSLMSVYKRFGESSRNWFKLQKTKTGTCAKCGAVARTHLHHLDPTLRPKKLIDSFPSFDLEIKYATADSILAGPQAVLYDYLTFALGEENLERTINYFSVSREEVVELCPICHKAAHEEIRLLMEDN